MSLPKHLWSWVAHCQLPLSYSMETALVVSKALSKILLENYGEIVHAFLFSVAGSQEVILTNR